MLTLLLWVALSLVPTDELCETEVDCVRPTLLPVVTPEDWDEDWEALLVAVWPKLLLTDSETPSERPVPKLTPFVLPIEWEVPKLSEYPFVRLSVRLLEIELETLCEWLVPKLYDWLVVLPMEVPLVILSVEPVELLHPELPPELWLEEEPCDQLEPEVLPHPLELLWLELPPILLP